MQASWPDPDTWSLLYCSLGASYGQSIVFKLLAMAVSLFFN